MDRSRSRARGAAVVEVLVIVAALLAIGLLAVRFVGTSSEATGVEQAKKVRALGAAEAAEERAGGAAPAVATGTPAPAATPAATGPAPAASSAPIESTVVPDDEAYDYFARGKSRKPPDPPPPPAIEGTATGTVEEDVLDVLGGAAGDFLVGFGEGAWDTVVGVATVAERAWNDPVGLGTDVVNAVDMVVSDPLGVAERIGDAIVASCEENFMKCAGRAGFEIAATLGPQAVTKVSKAGDVVDAAAAVRAGGAAVDAKVLVQAGEKIDGVRDAFEVAASTPVYRVQEPGLPLLPHESPYFRPSDYGLPEGKYDVLYVSPDHAGLSQLRTKQGYFADGLVMNETTLGQVVKDAGPDVMIFDDYKLDFSEGIKGYVIVRKVP